jgi:hypothetical protein
VSGRGCPTDFLRPVSLHKGSSIVCEIAWVWMVVVVFPVWRCVGEGLNYGGWGLKYVSVVEVVLKG